MRASLGLQGVWEIVDKRYTELETEASDALQNTRMKDQKAPSIIHQAIDDNTFEKISGATTAKQAWQILDSDYRAVEQVKKVQLQTLNDKYEALHMREAQSMSDFAAKVLKVVNQMKRYGEIINENQVVRKILCSLDEKFNFIVVIIEQSKYLSTMTLPQPVSSLQGYEDKLLKKQKDSIEQLLQTKLQLKEWKIIKKNVKVDKDKVEA